MRTALILLASIVLVQIPTSDQKCQGSRLGMFDCGDGQCVSANSVCDNKVDCTSTSKDEQNCDDHFRRRCITSTDALLNTENLTNTYLGYNIISGYTRPLLDHHFVDAHVRRRADCRRAELAQSISAADQIRRRGRLPLLAHNIENFTYVDEEDDQMEFKSMAFESAYLAFRDTKKRKSLVIESEIEYDHDLQSITLTDAYKTSRHPGGDFYWFDEQEFWQANTPFVRLSLEVVVARFRLRSIDRLVLTAELISDLNVVIERGGQIGGGAGGNRTDGSDIWWRFFERYGTHLPTEGTVGGSIEVIAKRKLCAKKNSTVKQQHHTVHMDEIQKCLVAKARHDSAEERLQCGKLDRKFGVQSTADILDWTHRRVIGGDESLLGAADRFPTSEQLDAWSRSLAADPRPLSTTLTAVCELIDHRFLLDQHIGADRSENSSSSSSAIDLLDNAKSSCQTSLTAYVRVKDVLHVPEPTMIPCREGAVPVWRLIEKKYVLRGLPWCFATSNEEGSCPSVAALSAAQAHVVKRGAAKTSGGTSKIGSSFVVICMAFLLVK